VGNQGVISGIVLSIVLLTILTISITTFVGSVQMNTDSKTTALLSTLKKEQNTVDTTVGNIKSGLEKLSTPNPGEFVIGATQIASALKDLVVAIPIAAYDTVRGIGAYFGLPDWVTNSVILVMTALVVFSVLSWLKGGGSI